MGHGAYSTFKGTWASGATLSGEVDLARAWAVSYLRVPSMSTNTQMHMKVATQTAGTFVRVINPVINSAATQVQLPFTIHSSLTGCAVPIPAGFRYIKIETTDTVQNGDSFDIICSDN